MLPHSLQTYSQAPAHEVTHIFQSVLSNEVGYSKGMPISLWEGSAVRFGGRDRAMPNIGWYNLMNLIMYYEDFISIHYRSEVKCGPQDLRGVAEIGEETEIRCRKRSWL